MYLYTFNIYFLLAAFILFLPPVVLIEDFRLFFFHMLALSYTFLFTFPATSVLWQAHEKLFIFRLFKIFSCFKDGYDEFQDFYMSKLEPEVLFFFFPSTNCLMKEAMFRFIFWCKLLLSQPEIYTTS